ncbi:MAG: hypothetical protein JWM11_7069 [Planctomycetaceae bacterium]|nr:hypothetical protein [Planctomycetaceae bacterium]
MRDYHHEIPLGWLLSRGRQDLQRGQPSLISRHNKQPKHRCATPGPASITGAFVATALICAPLSERGVVAKCSSLVKGLQMYRLVLRTVLIGMCGFLFSVATLLGQDAGGSAGGSSNKSSVATEAGTGTSTATDSGTGTTGTSTSGTGSAGTGTSGTSSSGSNTSRTNRTSDSSSSAGNRSGSDAGYAESNQRNYGWIGLFGLAGLLGLIPKGQSDRTRSNASAQRAAAT